MPKQNKRSAGLFIESQNWSFLALVVCRHGVIKYVELVQRPERNEQVDILTHQKWSGANLMDKQVTTVRFGRARVRKNLHNPCHTQRSNKSQGRKKRTCPAGVHSTGRRIAWSRSLMDKSPAGCLSVARSFPTYRSFMCIVHAFPLGGGNDYQVNTATGGLASTSAMGEGVTESQFATGSGGGGGGGASHRDARTVAVSQAVGASGFRAKL